MNSRLLLHYIFQVNMLLKINAEQTNGLTDYAHLNAEQTLEAGLDPYINNQTNEYIMTSTDNNRENNRIGSNYVSSARIGIRSKNM